MQFVRDLQVFNCVRYVFNILLVYAFIRKLPRKVCQPHLDDYGDKFLTLTEKLIDISVATLSNTKNLIITNTKFILEF